MLFSLRICPDGKISTKVAASDGNPAVRRDVQNGTGVVEADDPSFHVARRLDDLKAVNDELFHLIHDDDEFPVANIEKRKTDGG